MTTNRFIGTDRLYRNYIDGAFVDSTKDKIDVINPATGAVIARVPESDSAEVDRAVAAARTAQADWERRPEIGRAHV